MRAVAVDVDAATTTIAVANTASYIDPSKRAPGAREHIEEIGHDRVPWRRHRRRFGPGTHGGIRGSRRRSRVRTSSQVLLMLVLLLHLQDPRSC